MCIIQVASFGLLFGSRFSADFCSWTSSELVAFCLSTSIPVLTTSTYAVAWPQGDQLLGGGPWHKEYLPAAHWLSLPFYTPEGAWPLSPLAFISRLVVEEAPTRPEGRWLAPLRPPHLSQLLLWFLDIPAHSASGRLSLPSPSSPPPPLPPPLLPPLPPPLPPPHLRPNQGREALL